VKRILITLLAVAAVPALHAQTSGKIATIAIQQAIFQTKDGQKALADIQAKFNPVKAKLDAKKAEIAKDEDALRKGQNTMSPEAQQKLARDIDVATKALNRDTDDANNDLQEENQRLMNDLGGKIMAVVNKYASEKGYELVIDVSAQTSPVLYASNGIDITRDIIAAYDAGSASGPMTSAPKPGAAPTAKKTTPSGISAKP
jgi:outer membrane protein